MSSPESRNRVVSLESRQTDALLVNLGGKVSMVLKITGVPHFSESCIITFTP